LKKKITLFPNSLSKESLKHIPYANTAGTF
jgi:hypothetical protein